jgi:hypothetical protein
LLENLGIFAASAYRVLVDEGILETILRKKPVSSSATVAQAA